MKTIVLTEKGIEPIAAKELSNLTKIKNTEISECLVTFNTSSILDIYKIAYCSQTISGIGIILQEKKIEDKETKEKKIEKNEDKDKEIKSDKKGRDKEINDKGTRDKEDKDKESENKEDKDKKIKDKKGIINQIICLIKKHDWAKIIKKGRTFKVECRKIGIEDSSEEICKTAGEAVIKEFQENKKTATAPKVDLENPNIIITVYANKTDIIIAKNISRFDLSKRQYRIFTHPSSIKGTIAFSLTEIAEAKPSDNILDPFCRSGEIPIEAVISKTIPIRYFEKNRLIGNVDEIEGVNEKKIERLFERIDKEYRKKQSKKTYKSNIYAFDPEMRNVRAAEKNAKIAGCKGIKFSKTNTEWLDTRLKKETIDKIITKLPDISAATDQKKMEKTYNDFFYNAEYILKKKGTITTLSRNTEKIKEYAEKYKFKIKKGISVWQGKQELKVMVFSKSKANRKPHCNLLK